ncbi:MAG: hypothetical protein U0931_23080 [Vulcanimicrobiota bacterium]
MREEVTVLYEAKGGRRKLAGSFKALVASCVLLLAVFLILRWHGRSGYLAPTRVSAVADARVRAQQVGMDPQQRNLWIPRKWDSAGFHFTAVAEFQLVARVLIATAISDDTEAQLAPVDLTLGWGPMADPQFLKGVSLSHSGRFYHWETQDSSINTDLIVRHSANMHMIPKDRKVDRVLRQIKADEIISLAGYLVDIEAEEDGWHWESSRTRNDSGAGACEVVWLDAIYR